MLLRWIKMTPASKTLIGVGKALSRYRVTVMWSVVTVMLLVWQYPIPTLLGIPTGVILGVMVWGNLVLLSVMTPLEGETWWYESLLPRNDLRRAKQYWREEKQLIDGYEVAVMLQLVHPVEDAEHAKYLPRRFFPDATLTRTPGKVELETVQEKAATMEQIMNRAEAYAPVVGSSPDKVQVTRPKPDRVTITWWHEEPEDPLQEPISFEEGAQTVSYRAGLTPLAPIPVGVCEDGAAFRLRVFGRQILIVGESGSGKGSLIWSVMLQLAPAIHDQVINVYGIDLKGGVELWKGKDLFTRLADRYEDAIMVLETVSETLEERLKSMKERGERKHVDPTPEAPLVLLMIDEAASLIYQAPDTKTRNYADMLLKRILSTGRAAGVAVIAAIQDPRKEALTARDLFLDTIALRMDKSEVKLALSIDAYEQGAHAEKIRSTMPGTGYYIDQETMNVERFRAFWVSDETIDTINNRYRKNLAENEASSSITEEEPISEPLDLTEYLPHQVRHQQNRPYSSE